MGKTLVLKAEVREHTGRKAVQKMRRQGVIPAVVYGQKEEPVAVSLDAHDFVEGLHHGQRLMDIQIGKKKEKIIVKEVQYDHLGKNVIHADLMRVDITQSIRVTVPIELKGTAAGTHEGGIVEAHAGHLEVECMAADIPEKIVISVKDLHVGDALHAGDVGLPEGVKLITSAEMLLVTCHTVAVKTTEQVEEETPAVPEVITEKKESEEVEAPKE
jgi:large subunit ribosomal protein L25